MNKRLQQFLSAENLSQSQFADSIGVVRASVSHILSGRNKPGFDFIYGMANAYPKLNIDWFVTGRGKMYNLSPDAQVTPVAAEVSVEPEGNVATGDDADGVIDLFSQMEEVTAPLSGIPSVSGVSASRADTASGECYNNSGAGLSCSKADSVEGVRRNAGGPRKANRVILLFDDGSYQEIEA